MVNTKLDKKKIFGLQSVGNKITATINEHWEQAAGMDKQVYRQ